MISIHALLAECDLTCPLYTSETSSKFQSTHSLRSATCYELVDIYVVLFQSTHSLRSATFIIATVNHIHSISIHALLAECDPAQPPPVLLWSISIHALLAECDRANVSTENTKGDFNPRTPCGVRLNSFSSLVKPVNISIHALLAECDVSVISLKDYTPISIHALLAECDPAARRKRT